MKLNFTALVITWLFFGLSSYAHELPMFGKLPELDEQWTVHDKGAESRKGYSQSWIIFQNNVSGDVLSFREQRFEHNLKPKVYKGGPWAESGISTFPCGYPAWNKPPNLKVKYSSWASNDLVELSDGWPALQFTTYWEEESGVIRLAHGYTLYLGGLRILIQHTSKQAITLEFSHDMTDEATFLFSERTAKGSYKENIKTEQDGGGKRDK